MPKVTKRAIRYRFKIPDLLTISQLIDLSCGSPTENIVNFKLFEVVLVILARQLKMLQRRVQIELPENVNFTGSKLSVTEIKIHAKVKKKRRLPLIHTKMSPSKSKSMIGATNISRPVKRSPTRTLIVKPGSSTHVINKSEAEQSSNSDFIDRIQLTIKTTSDKTLIPKSYKLEKNIMERLKSYSETSEDEISTKYKKKGKHDAGPKKSTSKSGTVNRKSSSDESAIMSFLGQKYSSSLDKTSFEISSLDETRSEEPSSLSTKQITDLALIPENLESTDIIEDQYEKILLVERVPSEEAAARTGRLQGETRGKTPRTSIVTIEEFMELLVDFRKVQAKLDSTGTSDFSLNLLKVLRKGTAWCDGMAALHISACLEVSEKALVRMVTLVTDLAKRYPEIDTTSLSQIYSDNATDSNLPYHGDLPSSQTPAGSQIRIILSQELATSRESMRNRIPTPDVSLVHATEEDFVTEDELRTALKEVIYDSMMTPSLTQIIDKSVVDASTALQNAIKLEKNVKAALAVDNQMSQVESLVAKYADKINTTDAELTHKMSKYQEEILNMEYSLQSAIDNVIQAMAPKEDIEGKAELISCFNNFQILLNDTYTKQLVLEEVLSVCKEDVEILREQIELIRESKADRDELTEALRGKTGYETLNSMVLLENFYAVRGNFEKRINAALYKFNNREYNWQKAIDELEKLLDEKADQTQVMSLEKEIMYHVNRLKIKLSSMDQLFGGPNLTSFTRKVHRDTKCLSCSTPAHVKETVIPKLPLLSDLRPPILGAESVKNKICFPGLPIPHSKDPRARVCHRYCGGPSSKQKASRAPPGTIMKSVGWEIADTSTVDIIPKKPCIPCNIKTKVVQDKTPNESAVKLSDNVVNDEGPSMISTDFRRRS